MSQGLKPTFAPSSDARTKARAYLKSKKNSSTDSSDTASWTTSTGIAGVYAAALKDLNPTNRGYAAAGGRLLRWAGEGTGMTRIGYRMRVLRRAMILN